MVDFYATWCGPCKMLSPVIEKISDEDDSYNYYKVDVDNAKAKIKTLEEEIKTLEIDLADLNERFGKKDLNAVVEAGNREINAKMIAKQNEITRYREKIGELTEKARSINDLLINLKKDKEIKSARLENYIKGKEKKLGYKHLYLTSYHENYYEKTGWSFMEKAPACDGRYKRIYQRKDGTRDGRRGFYRLRAVPAGIEIRVQGALHIRYFGKRSV